MESIWDKIDGVIRDIESIDLNQSADNLKMDLENIVLGLEKVQELLY